MHMTSTFAEAYMTTVFEDYTQVEKVQFLVDNAETYDFDSLIRCLRDLGDCLNLFPDARTYLLNRLLSRVNNLDESILSNVYGVLREWIADLGPLPSLDKCYASAILSIAEDAIVQSLHFQ